METREQADARPIHRQGVDARAETVGPAFPARQEQPRVGGQAQSRSAELKPVAPERQQPLGRQALRQREERPESE